jgi:hypothetical protein
MSFNSMGIAGSTIMPDRLQATAPGMAIDGIRMSGTPGMAIIEVVYLSTNTVIL